MILHTSSPGIVGIVEQGGVRNNIHFKRVKEKPVYLGITAIVWQRVIRITPCNLKNTIPKSL